MIKGLYNNPYVARSIATGVASTQMMRDLGRGNPNYRLSATTP